MNDIRVEQLPPHAYFAACEAAGAGHGRSDEVSAFRLDLPTAGACLVALFPPAGACWGLPFRPTPDFDTWEEGRRVDRSFAAAVVAAVLDHYPSVAVAPAPFVRFAMLGENNDISIGADNHAPPLPTRVQTMCLPLDEAAIADGCRRFARFLEQLQGYAMLRPPGPAAEEWETQTHPRLQALFSPDHGRDVFVTETSTGTLAALSKALVEVSADEAAGWLTPLALAEEFVRFRYPVPVSRPTVRLPFLGGRAGAGDGGFPDPLAEVALLRAKLLRKWGWPTWLHHLIRTSEPVMHKAMLMNRPAWAALEDEVAPLLAQARERFPVLFET